MKGGNGVCSLENAAPVGGAEAFTDGELDDLVM